MFDVWRESGSRIGIFVVVLGAHLWIILALLQGSASPWRRPRGIAVAHDVLDLRFIPASVRASSRHVPRLAAAATREPTIQRSRRPQIVTTPSADNRIASVTPSQPSKTIRAELPATAYPGYIAGGGLLHSSSGNSQSHVRLPGSDIAIIRGIRLIDPQTQGIGGFAHKLQALFGIPDKHCINVDAWRRLSTQQMLDRHISPDEVDKVAAEYHCFPQVHDPWLQ